MKTIGRLAFLAGITCLGFCVTGCGAGSRNGVPVAGCPDGAVEYLVVSDAGEVEHKEGKFLDLVNRSDQKLVMVDCWATWCGPCRKLAPELDAIRKAWGDRIEVVKVDVDQSPEIARHLGVSSIPDVRIFRSGIQVESFTGYMPRQEIESLLKSLQ